MRLDKYLAETAQCTRSEAKTLLSRGRVTVNGAVCKKGDTQLREGDSVAVDGAPLAYQQFVYLMLNKPEGVVSASTDKRDTTVVDLIGDAYPRRELFPAGRLDKTSTGFVLLTDDGGFAHEILAPKRHVSKTYTVVIDTPLTEEMRRGFAEGVTLADGTALSPAEVEALTPDGLTVKVRLRQGCGSCGSAGVKDIVCKDNLFAGNRERDIASVDDRHIGNGSKVVAVERYVKDSDRDVGSLNTLYVFGDPLCDRHAPCSDSDKAQSVGSVVPFKDLVSYPHKRPAHCIRVKYPCLVSCFHAQKPPQAPKKALPTARLHKIRAQRPRMSSCRSLCTGLKIS